MLRALNPVSKEAGKDANQPNRVGHEDGKADYLWTQLILGAAAPPRSLFSQLASNPGGGRRVQIMKPRGRESQSRLLLPFFERLAREAAEGSLRRRITDTFGGCVALITSISQHLPFKPPACRSSGQRAPHSGELRDKNNSKYNPVMSH